MKKALTISILFILITIIGVRSFSVYQEKEVDDSFEETILSLTIDGVVSENFPSKESGKTIESIECDNDAVGSWDYESWGPIIRNVSKNRTKCQFNFVTKYHESILNGTDPVLKDGLIPVTIEDDGTVHRAYLGREWYDYETQRWANAVILEDESKKYYEGDIIPEDNIESYFVWIPKYRYKLWDLGNYTGLTSINTNKVHDIELIFGDYDTVDKEGECKAPGVSGESGNCSVGDYMTHPAFQSFGTKGLWVGKFEAGYKGATTKTEAEQNINDPEKIEIKPNVYSWRNINVSNMHLNSYNYKREYDSHMMKNTEWGAVAYLQHSIYGSRASVRINNNASWITGYAAVAEPTCGYPATNEDCKRYEETSLNVDGNYTKRYNTEIGYLASTTGNISGIYDMSGGAWEFVMGVMLFTDNKTPCVGTSSTYTSGFLGPYCHNTGTASGISFPEQKYYDTYFYSKNDTDYNRRILGDATGEMGPFERVTYGDKETQVGSWYTDEANGIRSAHPWYCRGSIYSYGSDSGMFAINRETGVGWSTIGFRLVLAF